MASDNGTEKARAKFRNRVKELRLVPASKLRPDEENWRRHGRTQRRHMESLLEDIGFAGAVLAREDENGIHLIDGHMRQEIASDDQEVPVLILDVDADEARKLLATYDSVGSFADADRSRLEAVIRKVKTGNDQVQNFIDRVAAKNRIIPPSHIPDPKKDLDDVPDLPKDPRTEPGQIYRLGRHLMICGDSRDAEVVKSLWGDDAADCVITDPPYGVSYVGKTADALTIDNDGVAGLLPLLKASLGLAYKTCRTGAPWYIFGPTGPNIYEFGVALRDLDIWRQTLLWIKDTMVLGRSDYHYQHEVIFYGWKGDNHTNHIGRSQTSLWEYPRPKRSKEHPTMKPVDMICRALKNSTDQDGRVYDPFGGSGSTLIACEMEKRECRTVELSPAYCDVIVQRWEELTGEKAIVVKGDET